MTMYNWGRVPKQFGWVARDDDDEIRAFKELPYPTDGEWRGQSNGQKGSAMGHLSGVVDAPSWLDSLEERPKPPKRYQIKRGNGLLQVIDTREDKPLSGYEIADLLNERER
jgi:hypothetical protein